MDTDVYLTAKYTDVWLTAKYTMDDWRENDHLCMKCSRFLCMEQILEEMSILAFHILLSEVWLITKNDYIVDCYIILLSACKQNADWEYVAILYRLWQYVNVYLYSENVSGLKAVAV